MANFFIVKNNTWVIETSLFIPVYRINSTDCIFFDCGWEYERDEIKAIIEKEGLIPKAVISTHFHRDHIGNMQWMRQTYGSWMIMPEIEDKAADNLMLAAVLSYPRTYRTVYNGHASICVKPDQVIPCEDATLDVCGVPIGIIKAPGHSIVQICLTTPDNVLYAADAFLGHTEVERAKILHHAFQIESRATMKRLKDLSCDMCIVAHKEITEDYKELIDFNLNRLDEQCSDILRHVYDLPTKQDIIHRTVAAKNMLGTDIGKAETCERNINYFINYLIDTQQIYARAIDGEIHYSVQEQG